MNDRLLNGIAGVALILGILALAKYLGLAPLILAILAPG